MIPFLSPRYAAPPLTPSDAGQDVMVRLRALEQGLGVVCRALSTVVRDPALVRDLEEWGGAGGDTAPSGEQAPSVRDGAGLGGRQASAGSAEDLSVISDRTDRSTSTSAGPVGPSPRDESPPTERSREDSAPTERGREPGGGAGAAGGAAPRRE